jgi:hypothetical protein
MVFLGPCVLLPSVFVNLRQFHEPWEISNSSEKIPSENYDPEDQAKIHFATLSSIFDLKCLSIAFKSEIKWKNQYSVP